MPKRTPLSDFEKPLSPSSFPNPFAKWASENEPRLKEFFVRGPLFSVLFREESELETRFIFGPPGSGKTAYRRMLERRLRPQNRNSAVLAANYFELNAPDRVAAERDGAALSWRALRRAALLAFFRDLLVDPQPFFTLSPLRRAQLARFFQELFPSQRLLMLADWLRRENYPTLADAVEAQDAQFAARMSKQREMLDGLRAPSDTEIPDEEMERLRALAALVERCGIQQICVLVDGVDKPVELNKPQDALAQILPLCHSLQLLDEMRIVVQFFLPQELATPLLENGVRFDRYKRYDLNWTDEQLTELLRQRLEIVTNGKISSLGQLAEAVIVKENKPPLAQRLDSEVVKHAHGSPRQLIRVADALFETYSTRAPRDGLFVQGDLDKAVAIVKDTLKRDSLVPPLVIDEKLKRVSVGEREIRLSAKELQCLILLKQKNGETLSRAEIWQELYNESNPSPSQIDPFFSRLRGKLERDSKHPVYLITERERGFRLENVGD